MYAIAYIEIVMNYLSSVKPLVSFASSLHIKGINRFITERVRGSHARDGYFCPVPPVAGDELKNLYPRSYKKNKWCANPKSSLYPLYADV
jgi:hypothetical protein